MINRQLVKKLAQQLKDDGVSALMVAPSADMVFLVGHKPYLCERFQAMVVTDDEKCFYICNMLTEDEAADFMDGEKVYSWFDCDDFTVTVKKAFEKIYSKLNAKNNSSAVGIGYAKEILSNNVIIDCGNRYNVAREYIMPFLV